jgi:transglutaminase-like putative cysteine protease
VLRRERDLERAMYDGRVTAHVVAPDIRIGDIIDYAYTIDGGQPIFEGRFATEVSFQWSCWVGETRVRILTDPQRAIVTRAWGDAPVETRRILDDGSIERGWAARDQAGVRVEQDVPDWVRPMARRRIADVMSWSEVARVFAPGYTPPERLPEELEAEVARLESATSDPTRRIMEALRLVQRGLRYHSISLGDGGFVPRSVDHIWAHRAGDCKDSSRLLVALLRRLGVEADPALVHTGLGQTLDLDAPNLVAFNHCIVRVRLEGRSYWLDPTRYPQGGELSNISQPRWGWALPLVDDAQLEAMGEDTPTPTCDVKEVYRLAALSGQAVVTGSAR